MSISFSKRWAKYLALKTGQNPENEAVLAFVIEVLALNFINIAIILSLGYIFNVLPGVITCLFTMALFRWTAGGAHSNSPWRCAVITAFVFLAIAILASHISLQEKTYIEVLSVISLVVGFLSVAKFAPVDSPDAPIISSSKRKRLKFMALLVIVFLVIAIILLHQATWIYAREIQATIILCILWGSFNLTRVGSGLMSFIDGLGTSAEKEVL